VSRTYYRTEAEARALRPTALQWISDLKRQLPAGQFDFDLATVFVGRTVPEEVGCVAVTLPGFSRSLTALEFALQDPPDEYADALVRYRERLAGERDDV
jgi:hypothetical protein